MRASMSNVYTAFNGRYLAKIYGLSGNWFLSEYIIYVVVDRLVINFDPLYSFRSLIFYSLEREREIGYLVITRSFQV